MKLTITPLLGEPKKDRLHSLTSCHALYEREIVKFCDRPHDFGRALEAAVKELLLSDRPAALTGKLNFVVQIELE